MSSHEQRPRVPADPQEWSGEAFTRQVSDVVRVPDLGQVEHRGRRIAARRRRITAAAVVGAVVVVVGGGTWLAGSWSQGGAGKPGPAVTPSLSPSVTPSVSPSPTDRPEGEGQQVDGAAAEAMVDGERAFLDSVALSPTDPRVRAALWRCGQQCGGVRAAIAFTEDGFRTRTVVRVGAAVSSIAWAGGDRFVSSSLRPGAAPLLWTSAGESQEVTVGGGAPKMDAPVVRIAGSGVRTVGLVAVDPVSGQSAEVAAPEGLRLADVQEVSWRAGRTTVLANADGAGVYWWTDDAGETWASHRLTVPRPELALFQLVPSGRGEAHAVVEGSDGATLFPFIALHRAGSAGQDWERATPDGAAPGRLTVEGVAMTSAGPVLSLTLWNDGGTEPDDAGLFRLDGTTPRPWGPELDGGPYPPTLVAAAGDQLLAITDGRTGWRLEGESWSELAVR